jgi:hypothetical protein
MSVQGMSGATRELYTTGRGHRTKQAVVDHEMYDRINLRSENLLLHVVYPIPADWLRERLSFSEREAVQAHVTEVIKSKETDADLREAVRQTNATLLSLRIADLDAAIPTVVSNPTDTSTTIPTSKHSSTTNTSTTDTSKLSHGTVRGPVRTPRPRPVSSKTQEDDASTGCRVSKWVKQVEGGRAPPPNSSSRSNTTAFHTARTDLSRSGSATSASRHREGSEFSVSETHAEELLVLAQQLNELEVAIDGFDVPHLRNDARQAVYTARRSIDGAWSTANSTQVAIAEAQADTAAAERIVENAIIDIAMCKSLEQLQLQQDELHRDSTPFNQPRGANTQPHSSAGAGIRITPQVVQTSAPQEPRYPSSPLPSYHSTPEPQSAAQVSTQQGPPCPVHSTGAASVPTPTPQQNTNHLHAHPPFGTNYNIYAPEARNLFFLQNNADRPVHSIGPPHMGTMLHFASKHHKNVVCRCPNPRHSHGSTSWVKHPEVRAKCTEYFRRNPYEWTCDSNQWRSVLLDMSGYVATIGR